MRTCSLLLHSGHLGMPTRCGQNACGAQIYTGFSVKLWRKSSSDIVATAGWPPVSVVFISFCSDVTAVVSLSRTLASGGSSADARSCFSPRALVARADGLTANTGPWRRPSGSFTACSSRSSSSTAKLIDVVVRDPIKLYYASVGSPRGPVPKGYGSGQPYGRPGPDDHPRPRAAAAGDDDSEHETHTTRPTRLPHAPGGFRERPRASAGR